MSQPTSSGADHRPANPSGLRQAYTPASRSDPSLPSESSSLLRAGNDGDDPYDNGTFLPRSGSASINGTETSDYESDMSGRPVAAQGTGWRERLTKRMKSKKIRTSNELAREAGVDDSKMMYLSYYMPCLRWLRQYRPRYLTGDLIAALTVASFYFPMALSYADNLAHVPPIHGLYAFFFNPMIYAVFGSSPALMVGPEATGSLLVGTVIKRVIDQAGGDEDPVLQAQVLGVISGIAGATILAAGLARVGFLDSVFSRPFLRGFISAVGFVIAVDQLLPQTGLIDLAKEQHVSHGSSVEKLSFLLRNVNNVHMLTVIISATSFVIIMVLRHIKMKLQPRYPAVAYVPDRFLVVVISTILAWQLDWESQGVAILGPVKAASGALLDFHWPFQLSQMKHIREAMSTAFLVALLGFFESTVAAKGLASGASSKAFSGMQLSANRELVALGVANLVGGCFMSLPAFGGYGKSKVKAATGGLSPMSCVFLSLIALVTILFLVPYMYFLPKPVLSSMISVVAISLIEEAPGDVLFFLRIRGWTELGLMSVIFFTTIFYSLSFGIAIGVGLSLLQVIRHATRPRIHILGRMPGTDRFENAETHPDMVEFVEGCLIVKIPEPLTFANTGELKTRLRRLERYGTNAAHPALPRLRSEQSNRNVIFDIHGVTSMDGSGAQVLLDIVKSYRERGVRVFFSRGPRSSRNKVRKLIVRSGIMELMGGEAHYVDDVQEALKLTEVEEEEEAVVPARRRSVDEGTSMLRA